LDFGEVLRRRRMVRAFEPAPVAPEALERILAAALRAPSAGNTQATDFVVLEGPAQTARYWDVTLPPDERTDFAWPDLLHAPVLVLPLARPQAYLDRYSEPDKVSTGLGGHEDRWPVPYWHIDAGFAAMLVLLATVDEGLGALFFGIFARERQLMRQLGVPDDRRPIGTIAIGHPTRDPRPSRSAGRPRRAPPDVIHRGGW
jgi:nitroreductase